MQKIKDRILFSYSSAKDYVLSWRMIVFLWVFFVALCLCYIFLFFSAKRIETLITFPGRDFNLKQLSNHPAWLISAERLNIKSSSWENIHGIFLNNDAEKTVYYFHGNGATMDHFYTEMRYIADMGYNLIAYTYPGYGESTGMPHEERVSEFSEEFYAVMQREKGIKDEDLIIWWYSVGTAVAIDFAKDKDFDSLVLFAPLSSRYDMSAKAFWFPLQKLFFMKNSFISKETIKNIEEPTLIVHGNTDIVVPFDQWKEVFENSRAENKSFIEIDDFGHSLITERYGEVLEWYIREFLSWEVWEKYTFLDRATATKILTEIQNEKYIAKLDLESDDSYQKYVDPQVSFTEKSYVPKDMRKLEREHIIDTKGNAQLREKAAEAFESMAEAFYDEFSEKVVVVSTYRSYAYQAGIKARGCPDNLCAKAWHSEHQSGLGIDVWSASTKWYWDSSQRLTSFYSWLSENAHLYGFHNPYRNGREIDGYDVEPWHWRYLGVKLATYLHEKDITFAEYYYKK